MKVGCDHFLDELKSLKRIDSDSTSDFIFSKPENLIRTEAIRVSVRKDLRFAESHSDLLSWFTAPLEDQFSLCDHLTHIFQFR